MAQLAEILRRHRSELDRRSGPRSRDCRRAMDDLVRCRTPALGGSLHACDDPACGALHFAYHSCRNRHCTRCHGAQTEEWLAKLRQLLLPCPYYLLTFTLPDRLRPLARVHPREVYDLLMRHAAGAVLQLAADRRWVGGRPGILAVLHTWTRTLTFHPHVHLLVTAGGMVPGQGTWIRPAHPRFLLPGYALSEIFRARVLHGLEKAGLLARAAPPPPKEKWVVHVQHGGDGQAVLGYLARYVHRVALTDSAIVHADDDGVTFRFVDSKTRERRTLTLGPLAFLDRFLQHVLPRAFVKVRYSGLFCVPCRPQLDVARKLLLRDRELRGLAAPAASETTAAPQRGPRTCPICGRGLLRVQRPLPRDPTWNPYHSPARGPP